MIINNDGVQFYTDKVNLAEIESIFDTITIAVKFVISILSIVPLATEVVILRPSATSSILTRLVCRSFDSFVN